LEDVLDTLVLDGLLLGDGGLYAAKDTHNAYFRQVCKHRDYLEIIRQLLELEDVEFGNDPFYFRGEGYNTWTLTSRTSPELSYHRRRWYPSKIKMIPLDINLSPVTTMHWYCGDGSLCPKRGCLSTIEFAAHAFTFDERERLKDQLRSIGFSAGNWKSGQIVIHKRSIPDFISYIGECPTSSFLYKWNYQQYRLEYPYTYAYRKAQKLKREALNTG